MRMKKFLSNIVGLVIYEAFGIIGFLIAGLSILESIGYGFLFALVLGCINEVRRDIWDLRKELKEIKNESATETNENKQ